jgi:hypothetical protein
MFGRNPMARILRFLDEQATTGDILRIMASLPAPLFVGTALEMATGQVGGRGQAKEEERRGKGSMAPGRPRPV